MSDILEVTKLIEQRDADFHKRLTEIEKKANRPLASMDGDFLPTREKTEQQKAFDLYLRKGDRAMTDADVKAMNTGSDPAGGYLVIPEMDAIIDRVAPTISAMFRLANIVEIGTAKYEKLVKTSGMAMRRIAEGSTGGETTEPTFAKIAIEVFPSEVEPWVNNETLEDSFIDLEADLANEAAIGFAEGAGVEFISGNGVGKARGILSYDIVQNSSYAWGKVGYIASGASAAFASTSPSDKLISLVAALPVEYRQGASFLMNDATLAVARQMKDASGSYYLWLADPTKPFGGTLLGYPVEVDDNMPALAAGSYSVAFGNFRRSYSIVNRTGTVLIRDPFTSKGQTKFNFRRRFGGGIVNYEALKLMKFSVT